MATIIENYDSTYLRVCETISDLLHKNKTKTNIFNTNLVVKETPFEVLKSIMPNYAIKNYMGINIPTSENRNPRSYLKINECADLTCQSINDPNTIQKLNLFLSFRKNIQDIISELDFTYSRFPTNIQKAKLMSEIYQSLGVNKTSKEIMQEYNLAFGFIPTLDTSFDQNYT